MNESRPPFEWRLLSPRYWPTWLGIALLWQLAYLPPLRRLVARGAGALIYARNRKRREIVHTNLEWCFPEKSDEERERMAREYFRYYVMVLLDTGLFWWIDKAHVRRNIVLEGGEALRRDAEAGDPIVVVTCHTLAMDRGGFALVFSAGLRMQSFFKRSRNAVLDWISIRGRTRFGGLLFPRDGGIRPVIRALKKGYNLYIVTDEDMGPESSVFAPFFGIPRATLTSPARIALMTKAKVYTSISYYDEARRCYVVKLQPVMEGFPSGDDLADATHINQSMEEMIRLAPEQYMWSLRLFQTFPDGSPPPYTMKGRPGSGPRPRPDSLDH